MWMGLVSGVLSLVLASADEGAKVVSEGVPDPSAVPDRNIPGFDGKLPTPQQLLEMLDSMTDMSDEEKANIKEDILKNMGQSPYVEGDLTMQTIILLSLLSLVAFIFLFFVYKLYRCLTERELKKEEKKKNKQLKKKK